MELLVCKLIILTMLAFQRILLFLLLVTSSDCIHESKSNRLLRGAKTLDLRRHDRNWSNHGTKKIATNASCSLKAELGFPWEDPDDAPYMGYHTDWLEVWYSEKDYCDAWTSQPWCTYHNTNSTEGSSTAYIGNVDDYYYDWAEEEDRLQVEHFTITSVAGKTTKFHVKHWFEEKDWYYAYDCWSDHMMAATLTIENLGKGVNVEDEEGNTAWSHPVDKKVGTHVNDEINDEYDGEFSISVKCDEECECHASGYTTTTQL